MELYSNVLQGPPTKKYLDVMKHSLAKTVNFRGKIISGGYPINVLKQMLEAVDIYSKKRDIKIAVLNDFALEATIELLRLDFCNISHIITDENIMDWVEEQFISAYKCPVEVPLIKFEELKLLKPEFDLIIANPPYSIGGTLIDACLPYCEKAVVIMPGSCFQHKNLYKKASSITRTEDKAFIDTGAIVADTIVAVLDKEERDIDYNKDFILYRYDESIIPFVKLNASSKNIEAEYSTNGGPPRELSKWNIETDFLIPSRIFDDGVHTDPNATDYQWNVNGVMSKKTYSCGLLRFKNRECKSNLARFWYKNSLMDKLVTGAHSSSLRVELFNLIPKIDYSVERDYEHLTLEDLIKILKEENETNN